MRRRNLIACSAMLERLSSGARSRTLCAALGSTLAAVGCGGGGGAPAAPTAVVDDGSFAAGTALSIVDGESGAPVAGARVVVAGQPYTSDGAGRVSLTTRVPADSLVDVVAPGILDRQTLLRRGGDTRFTVWPRATASGLHESLTAQLVYTDTGEGATPAAAGMRRPLFGTSTVAIVLPPDLQADPEVVAVHEAAAASLSAATGGQVRYVLGTSATSPVRVDVRYDPADAGCGERVRAYAQNSVRNGEVTGTRIVYCVADAPRASTVAHELGHAFGLRHSPDPSHLMYGFFVRGRGDELSPPESAAVALMLQRRGNNRFPDNDREAAAFGDTVDRFVCR